MATEKPLTGNHPGRWRGTGPRCLRAGRRLPSAAQGIAEHDSGSRSLEEVKDSNLRGRGGAGFPTGLKWSFVPARTHRTRDTWLLTPTRWSPARSRTGCCLEGDPHQLIEGMTLAGYATGTDVAYIFLRGEYKLAAERIAKAISEAYAAGYLGKNILGSGYSLELYLHVSAGRYMCGEETGMLNALEGKRANPRAKPPFPPVSGLFGQADHGQQRRDAVQRAAHHQQRRHVVQGLSRSKDGGTKLYGASGKVKRPGHMGIAHGHHDPGDS